jgi:hypothetical protein
MVVAQWNSIWKNIEPTIVLGLEVYVGERGLEEAAGVVSPPPGAARPRPRPLVVSLPPSPSLSHLLALWVFW